MKHPSPGLPLTGLRLAPAQVWGGVRLLPLIRDRVRGDLRLAQRRYDEDVAVIGLGGKPSGKGAKAFYCGYVPHGLVVDWSTRGTPATSYGGQLLRTEGRRANLGPVTARVASGMVRRERGNRLRMLPLHLALEGFLALHFGGPDVAWSEYSLHALTRGLSPRVEASVPGSRVQGLEDALRVFEIHEGQCGVLVFVADALAAAFVASHPDDYRSLHRTLIEDVYGDLVWRYGQLYTHVGEYSPTLELDQAESVQDLRNALAQLRDDWEDVQRYLADELFSRPLTYERVYSLGPFQLQRFVTDLALDGSNHLGECILRDDGAVEYLKTYRLSAAQTRRAFLLRQLSTHGWDLERTAGTLQTTKQALILRLENAGFGYLLKPHVLAQARRGP